MVSGSQAVIRVLGATRLEGPQGDAVALGGTLPRGFLAVLALEAGRPVSIDRLTSLLWGDDAPGGVKAALQQLASRVRRALNVCGLGEILHAVPPGYQLNVSPDVIDALLFRARVRIAAEAHRTGDHTGAAEYARQGLDLWSGNAFADLVELPLFSALGPGLDDERWRTEELRVEALLVIGGEPRLPSTSPPRRRSSLCASGSGSSRSPRSPPPAGHRKRCAARGPGSR